MTLWGRGKQLVMNATRKENKKTKNKTAIRFLTYWCIGILLSLLLDMCLRGVDLLNLIPMLIVVPTLAITSVAYWRSTSSQERKQDALRKISDPFYE